VLVPVPDKRPETKLSGSDFVRLARSTRLA
jgi:hypothetical protein